MRVFCEISRKAVRELAVMPPELDLLSPEWEPFLPELTVPPLDQGVLQRERHNHRSPTT